MSAVLGVLLGSTTLLAQEQPQPSLGDIARAERERRAQEAAPPRRVLTDEDLRREQILEFTAAEGEVVLVEGAAPAPAVLAHPEVSAVPAGPQVSLGEYARELRRRQAARRSLPVVENADLPRQRIIPREVLHAREMMAPAAAAPRHKSQGREAPPVTTAPAGEVSLGEVARRQRQERAQRRADRVALVSTPPGRSPARTTIARGARLPAWAPARETQAELCASPVAEGAVCVRDGDSLWKLARIHLGKGARWEEIWRANPEIAEPDLILAGQVLRLPEAAPQETGSPHRQLARQDSADPLNRRAAIAPLSPWEPLWLTPVQTRARVAPAAPAPAEASRIPRASDTSIRRST